MAKERKRLEKQGITDKGLINMLIEEKIKQYQMKHKGNKPFRSYEIPLYKPIQCQSVELEGLTFLYSS